MKGYFAIGVEGGGKAGNLGNLMRSAHGFGASFVFTLGGEHVQDPEFADTSRSVEDVPHYHFETLEDLVLPRLCTVVGVELVDGAAELPSFCHPRQAAYVLGPERGSLSEEMLARCDHVVKIPTSFCLNVATAGAIVMYDRVRMLGRWPVRPVTPWGEVEEAAPHAFGGRKQRGKKA